jgi:hypothetical protein
MISEKIYFVLLYGWIIAAIVIFPVLLRVTAPYGRHTTNTWGHTLSNRWAWFFMELPILFIFSWFFFKGNGEKGLPQYIFYGLFMAHYFHRVFIYPFRLKDNGKRMPLVIVAMALFFNFANGFFNGYWFGVLSPVYGNDWFTGWRFITGLILFIAGMYINISSDQILLNLRKGGKKGYYIPYGGLFGYVSSPNLLGEIIEWTGWAIMSWCLPSFSFALWTMANLVPRALDHHRWYKKRFPHYPVNRKALIPFIL